MGPVTYGVAWCPLDMKDEIQKIGFMDSKTLTEKNRAELLVAMSECENLRECCACPIPNTKLSMPLFQC